MIFVDGLQLENAREPDFAFTTKSTKRITAEEILHTKFKLKDTIEIPVSGEQHTFIVEHIRQLDNGRKKVYFVAKNIVGKSSMIPERINSFLDDFEANMPREIVNVMEPIEHKRFGFEFTRKLNLLSSANIRDRDGYDGYDDILFRGFETEIDRCKGYNGKTNWWWLCDLWERSRRISRFTNFNYVYPTGYIGIGVASGDYGVVPSFSIIQKVLENIA